ncbi:RNA polymerase sigma-70 factor (ECF subfamily) [Frondihabitans sp. PhB188]|uniref:RNA polymerase sigma factor n=1 Tax=Frondihabitans sp. PhB188 TaxID=2485200 RepID=UPI000FA60F69|nr:sigma-70 family RNA polymerase sigma factor [Frondihabitans sp. PhB188]ROQ37011.1 RNA polymerase sigma-70 factor (ECF subfamily) [Frondihabitans sp. PhB188]
MSDSDETETALWDRALRDDGDAFGSLFDRHQDRVYRRALGLVENAHDAEDIVGAAFFELWRKRRAVRIVDGSILPWLLVTTVNLARNSQRSHFRHQRLLRSMPRVEPTVELDAGAVEASRRLAESLRRLSPTDAALFVLASLDELPLAEAAAAVGLKPSTARMRLQRARTRVRADLHDLNPAIHLTAEGHRS